MSESVLTEPINVEKEVSKVAPGSACEEGPPRHSIHFRSHRLSSTR